MALRLGFLGFSGALLAGHLFRYYSGFRAGVSIGLALLVLLMAIGACAGIAAMYMRKPYLRGVDWAMGAFPAIVVGFCILGVVVVGALL